MVGVYTQPDRPSGRGKKTRKSPVKVLAEARGLPVFQPKTLSTQDARAEMESLKPDVAVVAAYGLILPRWTLDLPTYGVLNVHPSLLPRHRGPAPVANAILEGDEKTGVTVMKVEPKVDSGPILRSVSVEIGPRDTTGALTKGLAEIGARLLVETLRDWVRGLIEPIVQDDSLATYSRKATRGDGEISWDLPAVEIDRKIRAYDPWPGSFTTWMGRRLKVLEADPFEGGVGDPGMVMKGGGGGGANRVRAACIEESATGGESGDGDRGLHPRAPGVYWDEVGELTAVQVAEDGVGCIVSWSARDLSAGVCTAPT